MIKKDQNTIKKRPLEIKNTIKKRSKRNGFSLQKKIKNAGRKAGNATNAKWRLTFAPLYEVPNFLLTGEPF